MTTNVQVGTMLINDMPLISQLFQVESEPYSGDWSRVTALDGASLDKKIRAAGWNCFFLAAKMNATNFGAMNAENVLSALQRIIRRVRHKNFNCIEVTGIVAKRLLGVPYITISAHSRHIQKSNLLESAETRQTSKNDAAGARG